MKNPETVLTKPNPDSVYIISYTSGTTGVSKGAMLTHRGVLAATNIVDHFGLDFNENDVCISYLPYAHALE